MSEKTLQALFGDDPGYMAMCGYRTAKRFTLTVWTLCFITACVAIWLGWNDKSWGALWIAFIGAPIANGMIMFGSLICLSICRRRNSAVPRSAPMTAAFFGPLISSGSIIFCIFSMDLHGC
jgi:hypothetical protein